jgi:hypothetical protein
MERKPYTKKNIGLLRELFIKAGKSDAKEAEHVQSLCTKVKGKFWTLHYSVRQSEWESGDIEVEEALKPMVDELVEEWEEMVNLCEKSHGASLISGFGEKLSPALDKLKSIDTN